MPRRRGFLQAENECLKKIGLDDDTRVGSQRFQHGNDFQFVFDKCMDGAGDADASDKESRQPHQSQVAGELFEKSPKLWLGIPKGGHPRGVSRQLLT